MASNDDRSIPPLVADRDGKPSLLGLNNVMQQVFRTLHFLEGRVGLIGLRDGIKLLGVPEPVAVDDSAVIYFDSTTEKLRGSEAGGDFEDIIPDLLAVRVYNTANQSTTSGVTFTSSFDTERWDYGDFHDATNPTRLTIPATGLYDIGACVSFATNATGARQAFIVVNGGVDPIIKLSLPPPAANRAIINLSTHWFFTEGDYIELQTFQNSGGPLDIEFQTNHSVEFWATRVR